VDDAMLAMLLAEKPAVLSFHFDLPPPAYIAALKQAGIVLLATVTNPDEARVAAEAGIDAIVAQGVEAGGHRGVFEPAHDPLIGTLALTRLLSRQSPLPVIAAGGIMDGDGIRAVTTLGAIGAQLGTAFVVCPESAADASYRAALLDPGVRTEITSVISGRPARGIVHRFMREAGASSHPPLPDYPIAYDAGKALNAAARAQGSAQFAAHWAGQAAAMARVMCAAALIAKLAGEMHAA
ncbi:MAG TPA: nitronate monooxygenase, partial [Solimonas sp.]